MFRGRGDGWWKTILCCGGKLEPSWKKTGYRGGGTGGEEGAKVGCFRTTGLFEKEGCG